MSWTNRNFPNDPTKFLPPPTWLLWTEEVTGKQKLDANGEGIFTIHPTHGYKVYEYEYEDTGEGKIRHILSLAKVKTQLGSMKSRPTFYCNFAVYQWVDNEWVLTFEGKRGQKKADNLLYQIKISKTDVDRPHLDLAVEEALASIASVVAA